MHEWNSQRIKQNIAFRQKKNISFDLIMKDDAKQQEWLQKVTFAVIYSIGNIIDMNIIVIRGHVWWWGISCLSDTEKGLSHVRCTPCCIWLTICDVHPLTQTELLMYGTPFRIPVCSQQHTFDAESMRLSYPDKALDLPC